MTGLVVDVDSPMTTRDGVTLRADVYRPADGSPVPALLHRTPYDRTDPASVSALVADPVRLARHGYAVVVQDVRGRFGSDGDLRFFHQEQDDGHDAVEWAAAQPWCDGRVGIYGSSYHAMSAYQAVAARPPHLRAAVAMVGATDLAVTTHPGGLFELGFLTLYGLGQSAEAISRMDLPTPQKVLLMTHVAAALADPLGTVSILPLEDVPVLREFGFWTEWLDGVDGPPTLRDASAPEIPLLQVVGVRDVMAPTMLELAGRLPADGRHRTIIGPWAHGGTYTGHVGARTAPGAPGGVGTWGPVIAGWFDRHLRGREATTAGPLTRRLLGAPDGDPVTCYLPGEGWRELPSWPPPGRACTLHLTAGCGLAAEPGPAGERRYASDPADPFPTCGGVTAAAALGPDGIQDRRALDGRTDVLRYSSDALDAPLTVAGPVTVVVHLASTAEDVDVCVTLVDVEPDGFAAGVAEGALRTRHRDGSDTAWLEPGVTTELRVSLHDAAHTFRAGHLIRVEIAGANFPRLSRNLHTRTVPEHGSLADAVVAQQEVRHGAAHPTRIELHVPE